jgi:hypothetical protein
MTLGVKMLRSAVPLRLHVLTAAVQPAVLTTRTDATAAMKLFARNVEVRTLVR